MPISEQGCPITVKTSSVFGNHLLPLRTFFRSWYSFSCALIAIFFSQLVVNAVPCPQWNAEDQKSHLRAAAPISTAG